MGLLRPERHGLHGDLWAPALGVALALAIRILGWRGARFPFHALLLWTVPRRIVNVTTELDGFSFSDDFVDPPASRFDRSLRRAGDFSPGLEHRFTVQAFDDGGNSDAATRTWID